jgi:hypothetical protein
VFCIGISQEMRLSSESWNPPLKCNRHEEKSTLQAILGWRAELNSSPIEDVNPPAVVEWGNVGF